jgi:hypothetical protein
MCSKCRQEFILSKECITQKINEKEWLIHGFNRYDDPTIKEIK